MLRFFLKKQQEKLSIKSLNSYNKINWFLQNYDLNILSNDMIKTITKPKYFYNI